MSVLPHIPPQPLRSVVATAHGYRVPAYPGGLHRGLPSRHVTLVVELLAPLEVAGLGQTVTAYGVVGGLHTTPALIDASHAQEGVQYALTPFGALGLLGVSGAELHGHVVDLTDVFWAGASVLIEQLHGAASWAERFGVLDQALLRRLRPTGVAAPEVFEAWRVIMSAGGQVPVATVAAHVGWGRRHLVDQFRFATGLTPKQAARLARFEAAQRLLRCGGRHRLAELAVRCGYADQPHLAREWQAFTGCSIGTWLREELPFLQDANLGPEADSLA